MPILVYTEQQENNFTKQSLEAVSYAYSIAKKTNTDVFTICVNAQNTEILHQYGASKIFNIQSKGLDVFNAQIYAQIIAPYMEDICIFPHNSNALAIASSLSIISNRTIIPKISGLPENFKPFIIKKNAFSGKVLTTVESQEKVILTLQPNSWKIEENPTTGTKEAIVLDITNNLQLIEKEKISSKQDLTTSDVVVCAGRGLKSPENWKIIEELANALNGTTACTRPIADMDWRSYNEHAGQTGKTISPKLYIGVGVSGATQHIAGINQSGTIIVINNNPEAEFFKYADYGIIGDAMEVVPQITQKIKITKQ